jgi:uncharacterized protein
MIVLPITITIAAAAALVNLWIAARAAAARYPQKTLIGDGGNPTLAARMRAHANFTEYTPLFLILLGLIELAEGTKTWLWIVGIVFILARIAHVFGLDRDKPNVWRAAGFMVSFVAILGLAIYALTIPYRHNSLSPGITYAATGQAPASTLSPTKGLVRRS